MKFLSVCSGVGGLDMPLFERGFECVGFFELDAHASAVLKYHHKEVINYGDLTKQDEHQLPYFDILIGGTSCQSFSIAGKREGMEGVSGLFLHFAKVLKKYQPKYFIWENVKGALSSSDGWDFTRVLYELHEAGYGYKWQVLTASNHGIPQDRERVFVYGTHIGEKITDKFYSQTKKKDIRIVDRLVLPKESKISLWSYILGVKTSFPYLAVSKSDRIMTREYRSKLGTFNTLTTGVGCGHNSSMNVIFEEGVPRKLTPQECELIMGWPKNFTKYGIYTDDNVKEISDNQRFRMCGNGVVPECSRYILDSMLDPSNEECAENFLF